MHPLNAEVRRPVRREPEPVRPTVDAEALMRRWFEKTSQTALDNLARQLGVSATALRALKCGWSPEHRAWAFPMRDGSLRICGIRLRFENGRKLTVTGTHNGIFAPSWKVDRTVFVVEGPTDTAALLSIGKYAIGRPSCSGGIAHLSAACARLRIERAIIIADNDADKKLSNGETWNPGLDGARTLAKEIGIPCALLLLPCKDVREFVRIGGTSGMIDSLAGSVVWHQPR